MRANCFLFKSVCEEDFGSGKATIAFGFREMQLQSSQPYRWSHTTMYPQQGCASQGILLAPTGAL